MENNFKTESKMYEVQPCTVVKDKILGCCESEALFFGVYRKKECTDLKKEKNLLWVADFSTKVAAERFVQSKSF